MADDAYRVPAVVSAVRILDVLAGLNGAGATLSEVARAVGRPKSSVFNLLATLQAEGLVVADAGSRRFHLGPRLIPLGAAAAREVRPLQLTIERTRVFAAETGLSVTIAQVIDDGLAQVVEQAKPPAGLHVGITIGERFGVFDGAIGKMLLAGMAPEAADAAMRGATPPAHTARTLRDPVALAAAVAGARARGWATSLGELNENNAVAAAVRGARGEPVLVIAALGFAGQLGEDRIPEVGERLLALADGVSIETGGVPPEEEAA